MDVYSLQTWSPLSPHQQDRRQWLNDTSEAVEYHSSGGTGKANKEMQCTFHRDIFSTLIRTRTFHIQHFLPALSDQKHGHFMQPHLPPLPTVHIQNPGISQYLSLSVPSPSDQQLWVLLAIVETTSSMGCPLLWPRPIS